MADRVVYLNGQMVPERDAKVSIFDRGFVQGDAVFDAARTFRGQPYKLQEHLERLFRSLQYVRINLSLSLKELERITLDVLEANRLFLGDNDEHLFFIRVSRGPGSDVLTAGPPTIAVYCTPMPWDGAKFYRSGCHAILAQTRQVPPNTIDPRAKTTSRLYMTMAFLETKIWDPESYPLMLDGDGSLTEGTQYNLFLVRGGQLFTPASTSVLEGVSRDVVIELARDLKLEVEERRLQPYDLYVAEEAFLTTTSFCLLPITKFNGVSICGGSAGPIAMDLLSAWSERVGVDIVEQGLSHLRPEDRRALEAVSPAGRSSPVR